ncbi:GNAT family N-acetyltransferase [Streptomyces sp. AM8-1-1]|nr:GNAT family N-acetyltransferase [Streptomyces sp. AM8-1-1]WNO77404.1 GNAT family N-acetyltransferase [Streptomyces sp. AM8-1-1]
MLPEHRRRGLGTRLYERAWEQARALDAQVIETVVPASNQDGCASPSSTASSRSNAVCCARATPCTGSTYV